MARHGRTGDDGYTDSAGGRTRKDAAGPTALGALDELNAAVGLCLAEADRGDHAAIRELLGPIQRELLAAGADLAAEVSARRPTERRLPATAADRLERDIDAVSAELPELKRFVLPTGPELACRLHLARTIARRAERAVVAAVRPVEHRPHPLVAYLNRLGDLLFALARRAGRDSGEGDAAWIP